VHYLALNGLLERQARTHSDRRVRGGVEKGKELSRKERGIFRARARQRTRGLHPQLLTAFESLRELISRYCGNCGKPAYGWNRRRRTGDGAPLFDQIRHHRDACIF